MNRFYTCCVFIFAVLYGNVYGGALFSQQTNLDSSQFPSANAAVNNTISLSQKIANFTENGIEKLKSGVTSVINNVSNVFSSPKDGDHVVLGAACSVDANCSEVVNSTCDRGMCNCGPDFAVSANVSDRCLRIVNLGGVCEEDIQCSKTSPGAICSANHCVCSELYTEEEGRCVPKIKLGAACKNKDDCALLPFSDCMASLCGCPKPFISSVYNNGCLINASPAGEPPCQETKQCVASYGDKSSCINSICVCDHDYHPYNGKCLPDLKLGETCKMPYDCIVSKYTEEANLRECSNGTCFCKPGYLKIADNQCLKGYGYQLQASMAWLLCIFLIPYLL